MTRPYGSEIDIGFKTETELGDAGNRLFNANLSEIIGPFETDLGLAFQINRN